MIGLDDTDIRPLPDIQGDAAMASETYHAKLAAKEFDLHVQILISDQLSTLAPDKVEAVARMLETRAEVISAWTLTGEADYLHRVYCEDLAALNTLIRQVLLPHPAVARAKSQIVMDQFKADAPLPI